MKLHSSSPVGFLTNQSNDGADTIMLEVDSLRWAENSGYNKKYCCLMVFVGHSNNKHSSISLIKVW